MEVSFQSSDKNWLSQKRGDEVIVVYRSTETERVRLDVFRIPSEANSCAFGTKKNLFSQRVYCSEKRGTLRFGLGRNVVMIACLQSGRGGLGGLDYQYESFRAEGRWHRL
mmetsp:Transcript_40163/g.159644  ORF Transcript_40163/g.159644 Transcript_40163/m.159644 type:complete len:110 (+) Transcript_40163:1525-1854(+)